MTPDGVGEVHDFMPVIEGRATERHRVQIAHQGWQAVSRITDWLCEHWDQPDEGIWETRGGRKDFTYGRFQAWVALDRAIRLAQQRGRPANIALWITERDAVYRQIMERGWNPKVGAFTHLAAMDRELVSDSLVYRYNPSASPGGLRGGEGTFPSRSSSGARR